MRLEATSNLKPAFAMSLKKFAVEVSFQSNVEGHLVDTLASRCVAKWRREYETVSPVRSG